MIKNVCVFASSSDYLDEKFYQDASELGRLLAQNGFNIVYGGSKFGSMWACANEAKNNGGYIIGVMPEKLNNMSTNSKYCNELIITPCMRSRKEKMDKLSDAVIALAGGFGTLEELSEMIVQKQLGYNKKAIIILNTNNLYNNLLKFFDDLIEHKFANKLSKTIYYVANTPEDAINYLVNYKEPEKEINKADIYAR